MGQISPKAQAAQRAARKLDGKFGTQERHEADLIELENPTFATAQRLAVEANADVDVDDFADFVRYVWISSDNELPFNRSTFGDALRDYCSSQRFQPLDPDEFELGIGEPVRGVISHGEFVRYFDIANQNENVKQVMASYFDQQWGSRQFILRDTVTGETFESTLSNNWSRARVGTGTAFADRRIARVQQQVAILEAHADRIREQTVRQQITELYPNAAQVKFRRTDGGTLFPMEVKDSGGTALWNRALDHSNPKMTELAQWCQQNLTLMTGSRAFEDWGRKYETVDL